MTKLKKAYFVPLERKNEAQVMEDISLSPEQRVWRMFELMEALSLLKKEKVIEVVEGMICITLKRSQPNVQLSQGLR